MGTLNRDIIDSLKGKRLIFTVTTGRSGTAYLSAILGYVKGAYSCHEPEPEYSKVLRKVQTDPDAGIFFLLEEKLPMIVQKSGQIYFETSHLICKGFLEPILQLGLLPDLIIHRREPRNVSLSMYKMGTIPGRSEKGLKFYLSPDDPGVLEIHDWNALEDYQLCYWYCLEIERRARVYKKLFLERGARIVETNLEMLRTVNGFEEMISTLDLSLKFPSWLTKIRFKKSTSVKVNESKETKKDVILPENLKELEDEVVNRLASDKWREYFNRNQQLT